MPTAARVVVLPQAQGPLRIEEVTLPDPAPTQVVVKQFASGVCHSQLHQMHQPRESAVVLGHEATGVVTQVGSDVTHVKEGDTVLVTWVPRDITNARHTPLPATVETSEGTAQSQNVFTWADITIADEQYVVKAEDSIAKDVTAIIGCAVMTGAGAVINTANVQPGDSVAIFGVGGVGLSAVVGAKMAGANPIIAVDLDDAKLDFAKGFGATHGINAKNEEPIAAIHALTAGTGTTIMGTPVSGVDYAFDCIGIKQTMEQIVPAVRPGRFGANSGGTAVLVGVPQTNVELTAIDVLINEKSFVGSIGGSCAPDRDFPTFLQWEDEGNLRLADLVTARYRLDDINQATADLEAGKISGRAILEF